MSRISNPLGGGGGGLTRLPATVSVVSGVFTTVQVEQLIVTSGANIPAFDTLIINPGGTSQLGTVESGIWHGNAIEELYGGTGQSGYITGDVLYSDATDSLSTLASGDEGQVFSIIGGIIGWNDLGVSTPSGSVAALLPNVPAGATAQSAEWLQIRTSSGIRYIPVWT